MRAGKFHTSDNRANALWGRGGRRVGAVLTTVSCVLVVAIGAAGSSAGNGNGLNASKADAVAIKAMAGKLKAYIPGALLSAAEQNPTQSFDVILQGERKGKVANFLKKAFQDSQSNGQAVDAKQVKRQFQSIDGARVSLTGWQILALGMSKNVTSIIANEPVTKSSIDLPVSNSEKWGWSTGAAVDWTTQATSLQVPTIAIVDSGIDPSRSADFGNRLLGQVSLGSLAPNGPGDTYGHGTFVASIAAGAAAGHAGIAPSANLFSVDVMDDAGEATVADVIAGCDWILANKSQYNIKVANLSLHASNPASVFFDPLDQAVEKLWLNGVTVVTAAGNYAVGGQQSGVPFAPGNDPFVITVGAADIQNTLGVQDDTAAPWSAWGNTLDGFSKPDLSAPGRYMVGAMPDGATLATERPDHVLGGGYMQLSGTSFSAPAVAGAAALILAKHPDWTPDQVKGALMVSARGTPAATPGSLGVGELNVAFARTVTNPPNPNAGIDQFVTSDGNGGQIFDSAAWQSAAKANPAWDSAARSDAAWGDAAWSDAAWASAAWGDAAWSDAAWSDAAWSDAAWADAASGEALVTNSPISQSEIAQTEAALGIVNGTCDPTQGACTP